MACLNDGQPCLCDAVGARFDCSTNKRFPSFPPLSGNPITVVARAATPRRHSTVEIIYLHVCGGWHDVGGSGRRPGWRFLVLQCGSRLLPRHHIRITKSRTRHVSTDMSVSKS